jgi:hypothetical protein
MSPKQGVPKPLAFANLSPKQFLPKIFHGSHSLLKSGGMVLPAKSNPKFKDIARGGGEMAWATTDAKEAASYGPHVYEVQHMEDPKKTTNNPFPEEPVEGSEVFGSKQGFRVVKKVKR